MTSVLIRSGKARAVCKLKESASDLDYTVDLWCFFLKTTKLRGRRNVVFRKPISIAVYFFLEIEISSLDH